MIERLVSFKNIYVYNYNNLPECIQIVRFSVQHSVQHIHISCFFITPYPAKLIYLNFQPLEVVFRYSNPQPQVVESYS